MNFNHMAVAIGRREATAQRVAVQVEGDGLVDAEVLVCVVAY